MSNSLTVHGLYLESIGVLLYAEARGKTVRWAVMTRDGRTLASGCDTVPGRSPDLDAAADRRMARLAAQYGKGA